MKRSRTGWIIVCLTLSIFEGETSWGAIQEKLDTLFHSHPKAVWSIQIDDEGNGDTLFSLTPERRLIPASNEKLIVCSAALLRLGPDFQYETTFYTTGTITGSKLNGDLIITGSGDPSLGGRFFGGDITYSMREWAGILKEKGILEIQGNIIGVDEAFDDAPHGLNWHPSDLLEPYAAEVSALSFNDGCVDIITRGASKSGQLASIVLNPLTSYLPLNNSVQTVASNKQERGIVVRRDKNETSKLDVYGSIKANTSSTAYVPVPNPTLFFTSVLKESLEKAGITIHGSAIDSDDVTLPDKKTWQKIYTHQSMPLSQLISVCLKNSQNLYAEHFIKTLGYADYGVGTWNTGALAIKDIFFNYDCHLDPLYLADGSGLSRENRISASAIVNVLKVMDQSPYAETFFNALPQAGVDGTLKRRMRGTDAYGQVFAKTGTLNGIRALSGMIKAKSGKTYLFSILGNATSQAIRISDIMDDVCALISSQG